MVQFISEKPLFAQIKNLKKVIDFEKSDYTNIDIENGSYSLCNTQGYYILADSDENGSTKICFDHLAECDPLKTTEVLKSLI